MRTACVLAGRLHDGCGGGNSGSWQLHGGALATKILLRIVDS